MPSKDRHPEKAKLEYLTLRPACVHSSCDHAMDTILLGYNSFTKYKSKMKWEEMSVEESLLAAEGQLPI